MTGPARRRSGEPGATLVLVSLMLVFMLIIVAIVIDGGQAYTDRRRTQNATDAAALAGARAVGQTRFAGATADLRAAVLAVASTNGANAVDVFACDVVDQAVTVVAPCSPNSGWSGRADAAGVRVTAGIRRTTLFGSVAGRRQILVTTSATATLQPLLGTRSPWMLCGNPLLPGGYNLIDPNTRALRPDATLLALYGAGGTALAGNPAGIAVQGTLPGTCGLSPLWTGAVSPTSQPVRLGSRATALNSAPAGAYTYDDILPAGGCATSFSDGAPPCNAVIPVFDEADLTSNTALIVAWSIWRMTYSSSGTAKWRGVFLGAGTASGGTTSVAPVTGRSTYVVRMAR